MFHPNSTGGRFVRRLSFPLAGLALVTLAALSPAAAAVVDFDDLSLAAGSFFNGGPVTANAAWSSGGVAFSNQFTDFGGGFSSWSGFAYSNVVDTTTPGFGNQYAAYSLTVANAGNYGVAYFSAYDPAPAMVFSGPVAPQSVRLVNTTYTALDLQAGSAFSKKFGGVTGADPDWLSVTFTGYDAGGGITGEATVYLADFRFADSASDTVLSDWTEADLTPLGVEVRSIRLHFASSDVGAFGINTPTYVALDDLTFAAVPEPANAVAVAGLIGLAACAVRRRRVARAGLV